MSLPATIPSRKQRFEAALKLAGLTIERWRTEVYPVSATHLAAVFEGEREGSAALNGAIDAMIATHLPHLVTGAA